MKPQTMLRASLPIQLFECTSAWSTQGPFTCSFLCLECLLFPQPGHSNLASRSQISLPSGSLPESLSLGQIRCDPLMPRLIPFTACITLRCTCLDVHCPKEVSTMMESFYICTVQNGSHQPRTTIGTLGMWLVGLSK